jgi:hypothetical protein
MDLKDKKNQKGISIIEVVICLGIAVVIIFSIGKALAATHRLDTASGIQEQALAYGKQAMEITTQIMNTNFITDGNVLINDPLLIDATPALPFARTISMEPLCHDTNSNLISCNLSEHPTAEKITVIIKAQDLEKVRLTTIFTDWKNP